jgi:hypothetical protein
MPAESKNPTCITCVYVFAFSWLLETLMSALRDADIVFAELVQDAWRLRLGVHTQ